MGSKARNSSRRKHKRRKSKSAYEDSRRSKWNRIQVSFDEHWDQALHDPQYTNLIIRNPSSTRSRDQNHNNEKYQTEIKYLHSRLEDEMTRRKRAEQERDCLIASLDDMTRQARNLEKTLRDFEHENIDLYDKLKYYSAIRLKLRSMCIINSQN